MKATTDRIEEHDFFIFMQASHSALAGLAQELLAAVRANDRDSIHSLWVRFETQLLAHLEAEERYVLPAFARAVPDEALALIREHGTLREHILQTGVAIELHQVRLAMFEQFLAELLEHAKREEGVLYRWASTMIDRKLALLARRHIEIGERSTRR
jgi:hemerythrin superfamily protein